MNTTSKFDGPEHLATSLSRQFRRVTILSLLIGMTTSGAFAQGLSIGGSISLGGGSVASVGGTVGGLGGNVTVGGGSVASVGGSVGSIGGNATVGGGTALAEVDAGIGGVAGLNAQVLPNGKLATVCVQVKKGGGCQTQAQGTTPPTGGKPAVIPASVQDDDMPSPGKARACARSAAGTKTMNGFVVKDRNDILVGWVQGAQLNDDGKIVGLTLISTGAKCLTVKGGQFVSNGNQITSSIDASRLQ